MATVEQLNSTLHIEIRGIALVKESVPMTVMLLDVVQRAASFADSASKVTITVAEPRKDGSIEYAMHVEYTRGGSIFIGCIRRAPYQPTEYHS